MKISSSDRQSSQPVIDREQPAPVPHDTLPALVEVMEGLNSLAEGLGQQVASQSMQATA